MPKLTPVPLSRGTKLAVDQLSSNLVPARNMLQGPTTDKDNYGQKYGRFDVAIPIPSISAKLMEYEHGRLAIPIPLLPLQDEWDTTLVPTSTTPCPRLRAISISLNQRAEGYGIADYSSTEEGKMTATNMDRYDTTFELVTKPLSMTTTGIDRYARNIKSLWKTVLPGVDLLSNPDATPVVFKDLQETLNPYSGHWLLVSCPGLFTVVPTETTCAIPNLMVVLTFDRVLVSRDQDMQNSPLITGVQATPLTLSLPSSNALVTETHVQGNMGVLDAVVAQRLEAGWQEYGEIPPTEQTTLDSSYSVVAIPLWAGWEDVRQQDVATAGMPYSTGPGFLNPTADRRLAVLPDGFVIHHCLLWRSQAGFPCPLTGGYAAGMGQVVSPTMQMLIGLNLVQGWNTDNTRYQPAAYLPLNGASLSDNTVDLLGQLDNYVPYMDGSLHYIPLVYAAVDPSTNGFYPTGKPIYFGRGTRKTSPRSTIGSIPAGPALGTPITQGQETHVEARWVIQDPAAGLDGGPVDSAVLGYAGGVLYIVGKMPLASGDK